MTTPTLKERVELVKANLPCPVYASSTRRHDIDKLLTAIFDEIERRAKAKWEGDYEDADTLRGECFQEVRKELGLERKL